MKTNTASNTGGVCVRISDTAYSSIGSKTINLEHISLVKIKLSSKQDNKLKHQISRELLQGSNKTISDYDFDTKFKENYEIRKKLLENKLYSKAQELFPVFKAELDLIRNNKRKSDFIYEEFISSTKRLIREDYQEQVNYGNYEAIPIPERISDKYISKFLHTHYNDQWKELNKLKESCSFISNNLDWALSYFDLFLKEGVFTQFQTSLNLLISANKKRMSRVAKSGYTNNSLLYFSRNRFCAYSQRNRAIVSEKQLTSTLRYWKKQDYIHTFLTISPRNIFNLCKDDILNFSKILKEFFRNKRIKEKYKGYYGFLEIKDKGNDEYNLHIHLMCLRDRKTGYIDNFELSSILESISNKFGNDKLKGSKMIKALSPDFHLKNDVDLSAVRYIHQYISKGISIRSDSARQKVIKATEGIRFLRSGGELLFNNQKNLGTKNHILDTLSSQDKFGITTPLDFSDNYKDNFLYIIPTKKLSFENLCLTRVCSLKTRKEKTIYTYFFQQVKHNFYYYQKKLCPFSNTPLLFQKLTANKKVTLWQEPFFIIDALIELGLQDQAKLFANNVGIDFSKLPDNNIYFDVYNNQSDLEVLSEL